MFSWSIIFSGNIFKCVIEETSVFSIYYVQYLKRSNANYNFNFFQNSHPAQAIQGSDIHNSYVIDIRARYTRQ